MKQHECPSCQYLRTEIRKLKKQYRESIKRHKHIFKCMVTGKNLAISELNTLYDASVKDLVDLRRSRKRYYH